MNMEGHKNYSKIIAGTMTWGSWGKQFTTAKMVELMRDCVSLGITTFDHADIYGDYQNEADFGKAFAESGIERSSIQLISKCGIQMPKGRANKVKHYQYDAAYIIDAAERSLKQLQTGYLDLFLLHRPSPLMHPEAIAQAVDQLLSRGMIKSFGVSNFLPSQMALLETMIPVAANQVEFSLTHTAPMYDGTFDDCLAKKRMAMAWSPLGTFFREENERNKRIAMVLAELEEKYAAEASQLLLAFVLKHPAGVFPVVGTTNKARLKAALTALNIELELQDWFLLLEASHGRRVP